MTENSYGITTFCDDIRMEVDGKITLVGCYGNEISILGIAPAFLPIFCAFVNFRGPTSLDFKEISIVISGEFGGQVTELGRVSVPRKDDGKNEISDAKSLALAIPFKFSPLVIPGEGFVRSRAYVDDIEVKLGSIEILLKPPVTNQPQHS
jgi:hypothetical protein